MENKVKDFNYYVVLAFMVKDLKLKGIERDVYAIIYGFSQNEGKFTGSLQYLIDWTCSSKQGVINALNKLIEKNLIVKNEVYYNNVKFVEYFTSSQESRLGVSNNLTRGSQESRPNNINNNINDNINNTYGKFKRIKLSEKEYNKLCEDFTKEYIDKLINELDEYVESNNNKNKYTNYNLVIRKAIRENWFAKEKRKVAFQTKFTINKNKDEMADAKML